MFGPNAEHHSTPHRRRSDWRRRRRWRRPNSEKYALLIYLIRNRNMVFLCIVSGWNGSKKHKHYQVLCRFLYIQKKRSKNIMSIILPQSWHFAYGTRSALPAEISTSTWTTNKFRLLQWDCIRFASSCIFERQAPTTATANGHTSS